MSSNIILAMTTEENPQVAIYTRDDYPAYMNLPLVDSFPDWRDAAYTYYGFRILAKHKEQNAGTVEGHSVLRLLVPAPFDLRNGGGHWRDAEAYLRVLAGPLPLRPVFARCFELAKRRAKQAQTT